MSKIAVLGDGGWGTALALTALKNNHNVFLWGAFDNNIQEIRRTRRNPFLKGVELPDALTATSSMEEAVSGAEFIILSTPSQFMRGTLTKYKPFFDAEKQILINVAKGIENETLKCMHQVCFDVLGESCYTTLSGPSHAEEVARNVPTAVVVAGTELEQAKRVQQALMSADFRIYTGGDVIGVELGGALKNVLAIAAGILDGIGFGDNTKAAMMTRGNAEMARLGVALGGKRETFSGLSGIGDLIVTCMSRHSRNRHVGEELGKGKSLEQITEEMGMVVAEGVRTSISAHTLSVRKQCETPITDAVFDILYNGLSAKDAAARLMTRSAKEELE